MKKKSITSLLVLSAFLLTIYSCGKEELKIDYSYYPADDFSLISETLDLPDYPLNYKFTLPSYVNSKVISFDADKATLGRVLFYDTNLSKDRSVSCASCHKQEIAFSDDVALSRGVQNNVTDRNSIALGSVFSFEETYSGQINTSIGSAQQRIAFFWDNRAHSVSEQATQTFANEQEMGMSIPEVMARISEMPYYAPLIRAAYGSSDPYSFGEAQMLEALTVFINSIGSFNSPFDRELEKVGRHQFGNLADATFSGFSAKQNLGKTLFINNCASCHGSTNGVPTKLEANNGLSESYEDEGMGAITGWSRHDGVFKVPILRNIMLTAPYMHDGRFETIEEVIEHYSTGVKNHPNLDPELKTGNTVKKFNFTTEEKTALVAFMETFTDQTLLNDVRYSDPFKK